jgi:glycine betaine/choline ABC-type transport system substrate-binding protein
MLKKIITFTLAALMLLSAATAFGCAKKADNTELTLYEGEYSEVTLVHYMVKYIVEEYTDLTVNIKDQMSLTNMFKEVSAEEPACDILLNYDGTLLGAWLQKDVADVPADVTLYDYVKDNLKEQYGVDTLGLLGINNTYAIAVLPDTAEEYGLSKISDLTPVASELTFGAESSFFAQEFTDRYWQFVEFYQLNFASYSSIDINLKYTAIANDNFDVTEVYTTDGLNRKYDLVILEDDLGFFPEYNGVLVIRNGLFEDYAETAPNLAEVLDMLTGSLTNDAMTNMTYAVDVEEQEASDVAREYLVSQGLLTE